LKFVSNHKLLIRLGALILDGDHPIRIPSPYPGFIDTFAFRCGRQYLATAMKMSFQIFTISLLPSGRYIAVGDLGNFSPLLNFS